MQLTKHKVGTLNFTLTDNENNILDQTNDGTFNYLHGTENIIPGLENALAWKQPGDKISVIVEPENGYGEHDPKKIEHVDKSMFPADVELEIGMQFHAESSDGDPITLTIKAIEENEVIVDGNHPMAGIQLHFAVDVVAVRDATEEEIQQGHVHGPHGP